MGLISPRTVRAPLVRHIDRTAVSQADPVLLLADPTLHEIAESASVILFTATRSPDANDAAIDDPSPTTDSTANALTPTDTANATTARSPPPPPASRRT